MWIYLLAGAIWLAIIFGWLIPVAKKRIIYEIFMAVGLGIYFSTIIIAPTLASNYSHILIFKSLNIKSLQYIGYITFAPAAFFVVFSFISLIRFGKTKSGWEHTTKVIDRNVFKIVRHPLYLGGAIFSIGFILVVQSIFTLILTLICIFCFFIASRLEDNYNLKKFGSSYKEYMKKVPRWNFISGLIRLKNK
jgi:protein-S-isoprenylcysteine O-methyltransferase Ste14